jgi:hypothetical protein
LYTLKLQDLLFSHDIFAMVPLIGAILLGYEKKILKVPNHLLNDHLLRPDELGLPTFGYLEKKFWDLSKGEETIKEELFEVCEILGEIDHKDLGVVNDHLKALLVYKQLFCERNKFWVFEAKKQVLMVELAYEERFITNFHIDKEYYEEILELKVGKVLLKGIKEDGDKSIIEFSNSSVCNGGDLDIKT